MSRGLEHMERVCRSCRTPFKLKRRDQKFCSRVCSDYHHKVYMPRWEREQGGAQSKNCFIEELTFDCEVEVFDAYSVDLSDKGLSSMIAGSESEDIVIMVVEDNSFIKRQKLSPGKGYI